MNTMKICPGCQKPLAAGAPDGLCPACLMKAGMDTGADIGLDNQAESGRTPFVAPSVEEVARVFSQLEILGFIGQGGMGAVYRARQKSLDRVVALKILPPGIGKDATFAERFTREAKALARLNHPGVVTIYEFGQADGLFFFLMEFVDGMSLRHLLEVERISPREALAIVPQICDALQYAHDQGIVHRDIKPENILMDRLGRVKVADFGLAKLVGTDAGGSPPTPALSPSGGEGAPTLTDAGKVMGTPQYMAPEQREHPTEVDHRADIYSLGVVFYQMLTGELPGKPIEAPSSRAGGLQIDVRLDEVVLRALEKEPQRRYQQVSQVKTAVETIAQSPAPARPANRADKSAPRLLKGGASFVTTPEQLGTFDGQFFLFRRRSQLLLDDRKLTVSRAGAFTVIPLAAIRDLSIGHYPRTMHPMSLDFISVTYDEEGQTKRLFFSPYESWFGPPSNFNRIVAEWLAAIRAAIVAATGHEPGNTPAEQLGVPSGSMAIYALLLAPVVLAGTFLLAGVVMGQHARDAATDSFPGGLVLPILAMLALAILAPFVFGRFFGGSRKPAAPPRFSRTAIVALLLSLGGCMLSLLLGLVLFQSWGWVYGSFFAIETAALILGIVAWDKRTGKAAVILSFALMLAWIPGVISHMAQVAPNSFRKESPRKAAAASPYRVLEVRCEGQRAIISAELDDLHELRLFIGSEALGWSLQHTGSTSVTATVEASSQIKMEDGSMGRGLIFQAWGSRAYIAITPEGSVPYGKVLFRTNSMITQKDGTFTFADIHQSDGTSVPVSIRVRPVSEKSPGSQGFGPVIERMISTQDANKREENSRLKGQKNERPN